MFASFADGNLDAGRMHVLSTTIHEIATQLTAAKPNAAHWSGQAASAFELALEAAIHDLISLANSVTVQS